MTVPYWLTRLTQINQNGHYTGRYLYGIWIASMIKNPRCAAPAIELILAGWKQEASPYDDPRYQIPTCQRERLLPEIPTKSTRCATHAMDDIRRLEHEYERRAAAGETEESILKSWGKYG